MTGFWDTKPIKHGLVTFYSRAKPGPTFLRGIEILKAATPPSTAELIAAKTGIPYSTLVRYLEMMERTGLVAVVGFTGKNGRARLYARRCAVVKVVE